MQRLKVALTFHEKPRLFSIKRFEELFELHYCPQLEFANWEVEQWVRRKCQRAHQKGRIQNLALWLGKLHGAQIEKGEAPDLTIRWVNAQIGYGLFTNRPLPKWEFIGEYTGILRQRALFFANINDYCFMYPREWLPFKPLTIDSQNHGNYTRFINHSDTPNCESISVYHNGVFHIIFRTIEEIPADKELTYDYGSIYWCKRKKLPLQSAEELISPEELRKIL